MAEHLTLDDLLEVVRIVDAHIDASAGPDYRENALARLWARVTKCCEEAGELAEALRSGTLDEALGEAGDVISAAMCAIQHLTKNPAATWAAVSAASPVPAAGPLTVTSLLDCAQAAAARPRWWQMPTPCEKAGKVWAALSRWTGENCRKGVCGTQEDVLTALAEVAWAGLLTIQHLTGDTAETWAVVSAAFNKARNRIPAQAAGTA